MRWHTGLPDGARCTLSELHAMVQEAMGWEDCHMHAFEVAGRRFGEPDPELEMDDESGITLGEIVASGVVRFRYEYDFGDGWEHEVGVEKTTLELFLFSGQVLA